MAAIHNYFTAILFYPFWKLAGGIGILLVFGLLLTLTCVVISFTKRLDNFGKVVLLSLFLGPVGYYLFDHPTWGYHVELTFPMLTTLLTFSYLRWQETGYKKLYFLAASVLCLSKEEGALIGGLVIVGVVLWNHCQKPFLKSDPLIISILKKSGFYFLAFLVSMLFLWSMSFVSEHVLSLPVSTDASHKTIFALKTLYSAFSLESERHARLLFYSLQCIALLLAVYLPFTRPKMIQACCIIFVITLPVLLICSVAAAQYSFVLSHGLLWPPRLSTILSIVYPVILLSQIERKRIAKKESTSKIALVLFLSVGAQVLWLDYVYKYPLSDRFNLAWILYSKATQYRKLTQGDYKTLKCLASHMDSSTVIETSDNLFAIFDKQMPSWHYPESRKFRYQDPSFIICEKEGRLRNPFMCHQVEKKFKESYIQLDLEKLSIFYSRNHRNVINLCINNE